MYKASASRTHAKSKVPHSPSTLGRLARLVFTLYLLTAISYTSWHFLLQPITSIILYGSVAGRPAPSVGVADDLSFLPASKADLEAKIERALQINEDKGERLWGKPTKKQRGMTGSMTGGQQPLRTDAVNASDPMAPIVSHYSVTGEDWSSDLMHWYPQSDSRSHPHGRHAHSALRSAQDIHRKATPMAEDFFLSKAFGESLQPSKVVPYYYKASADIAQEDITITTLVTSNRLKVLANLVEHYQGPVSVTIHITNNPETKAELLDSLHALYTSVPAMSKWVDVHLVVDNFDRQFNMWRNVAKFFARTDYVMMLDVDFWICTDFRTRILGSPVILSKLREGTAAFVIPAFEFNKQEDGVDVATFPTDKAALLDLVNAGTIDMFHKGWQPGHAPTNYTRYYQSKPGEVYRVHSYTHSYEPYVIYRKEGTPFCDERFIGYGGNKAACLYELYLSGVSYFILPDDFLIHQSHPYAEKARKHERRYNRKLYTDFREELCFRYLNQFIEAGQIDQPRAKNLLIECRRIKGWVNASQRLIAAGT